MTTMPMPVPTEQAADVPATDVPVNADPVHTAPATPATAAPPSPWQITGGRPTDEETAALTAVLTALLAHHAASREVPARPTPTDTVWDRPHHNRPVRTGSWRSR